MGASGSTSLALADQELQAFQQAVQFGFNTFKLKGANPPYRVEAFKNADKARGSGWLNLTCPPDRWLLKYPQDIDVINPKTGKWVYQIEWENQDRTLRGEESPSWIISNIQNQELARAHRMGKTYVVSMKSPENGKYVDVLAVVSNLSQYDTTPTIQVLDWPLAKQIGFSGGPLGVRSHGNYCIDPYYLNTETLIVTELHAQQEILDMVRCFRLVQDAHGGPPTDIDYMLAVHPSLHPGIGALIWLAVFAAHDVAPMQRDRSFQL